MRRLLIVFAKNPVKGKVKTRLASTIGEESALEVYCKLLKYTFEITRKLACDKVIYHSDFIPPDNKWRNAGFFEVTQVGQDLGNRMMNAFADAFQKHYAHVIIIGSDCVELSTEKIQRAFDLLEQEDVVIGPANDGGYYLLGMKRFHRELFLNKTWSTKYVLQETLKDVLDLNLSFYLLEELRDIDTEEDLFASPHFKIEK